MANKYIVAGYFEFQPTSEKFNSLGGEGNFYDLPFEDRQQWMVKKHFVLTITAESAEDLSEMLDFYGKMKFKQYREGYYMSRYDQLVAHVDSVTVDTFKFTG